MLAVKSKKGVSLFGRSPNKTAGWSHCPRCEKGNMYPEYNDEHVCLQCGYRHYPGAAVMRLS